MAVTDSFQTFVVEQLNQVVPPVRARRMFGGVGIYSADVFFALIDDDLVYFKTDESTKGEFEARGMRPFQPSGEGGETMRYHALPEDVLESPDALREWAGKAIGVARKARVRPARRRGS